MTIPTALDDASRHFAKLHLEMEDDGNHLRTAEGELLNRVDVVLLIRSLMHWKDERPRTIADYVKEHKRR